ncbi:MAG: DNA replication initiation factor [Gammaproteobacteria bacterium]|nr:DNA replication initiation factor [Gammaproteobacteria bacterium]
MSNSKQLVFQWNKANKSRFDDFYFDSLNKKVKDSLINSGDIFLYGLRRTGKTYLLQSLCNYYSIENRTSLYIPLKEVKNLGSEITDSLEDLDLICIDDIDLIAGDNGWEIAIFNLINNCLLTNCRIVFCSSLNLSNINFELKDLVSRIKKIDSIEIFPVHERNLSNAIKFIAYTKSINLGEREIDYLIRYSERSIYSLVKIVEKLDKASLELKRKITIPLIKEVIHIQT